MGTTVGGEVGLGGAATQAHSNTIFSDSTANSRFLFMVPLLRKHLIRTCEHCSKTERQKVDKSINFPKWREKSEPGLLT